MSEGRSPSRQALRAEISELRRRLEEAEDGLRAIREGAVDAIVVEGQGGPRLFALDEQDSLYRLMIETMQEAGLAVSPQGTVLFANPRFGDLLQRPPGQLLGQPLQDLVHPEDRPAVAAILEQAARQPGSARVRFVTAGGEPLPLYLWASFLEQGEDSMVCLLGTDLSQLESSQGMIRQLREQRQALHESEARFRTMADGLPLLVWVTDEQGQQQVANRTLCEYLGVTEEEVRGSRWRAFLHPEDADEYLAELSACVRERRPFHASARLRRADGQWRWVESFARPRRAGGERFLGYVGASLDITERRQADAALVEANEQLQGQAEELQSQAEELRAQTEEMGTINAALRESEARFRAAIDHFPYAFVIYGPDLRIQYINRAGVARSGLREEDIIGHTDVEILPPEVTQTYVLELRAALHTRTTRTFETTHALASGRSTILVHYVPLRDEGGQVAQILGITHDITERKQAEEERREAHQLVAAQAAELAAANEELRHASEVLELRVEERTRQLRDRAEQLARLSSALTLAEQRERRRLADVLHDHLLQLLVGAGFGLQVACRRAGGEQRADLERVRELLDQAVEASRALTVELSPPVLHVGGLAAGLQWLARWMEERHGLHVEVRADERADPATEDVRLLLFEAVRELLLNVARHAHVREARVVLAALDEGLLEVQVSDEGWGFDPQAAAAAGRGHGAFGLFSIHERMALLGGRLEIDSGPGLGTRMRLVAPRVPGAGGQPPAPAPAPQAPTRILRVLLVDDHAVVRQGLSRLLAGEADLVVVGEAADGREALYKAHQLQPDVILMDVSMPEMDGVQATLRIRAELPHIRIIGLSMFGEAERAAAMRQAGAAAHVDKAGAAAALLAAIRQAP